MNLQTEHKKNTQNVNYNDLLVRIAKKRDQKAFIEIFHFFAPRLKSYLLKRGQDETSAEEIVQNTMLTIWEKAHKYSPEKAAASTWIFTIARNKLIDAARKRKRTYVDSDSLAILNATEEIKENYADEKIIQKLSTALNDLPEEQARLVHMAFFDDKTHAVIAKETHIPLGTVKSRIRGALNKLRHILGAKK